MCIIGSPDMSSSLIRKREGKFMLLKTDPSESVIANFKVEGQRVSGPWAGGVFTSLHLLHRKKQ